MRHKNTGAGTSAQRVENKEYWAKKAKFDQEREKFIKRNHNTAAAERLLEMYWFKVLRFRRLCNDQAEQYWTGKFETALLFVYEVRG